VALKKTAEISREEAIKELNIAKVFLHESRGLHRCTIDAFGKAIEAIKKADKYRWHDMRKNPEDLPSDDCEDDFFTVAVNGTDEDGHKCGGYVMIAAYLYDGTWDVCDTLEVIAWRYIEPFESEVEDERKEETP